MVRHSVKYYFGLSFIAFLINGCSNSPIYLTKTVRDGNMPLGLAYYKSAEAKGVLTIDRVKETDPIKTNLDLIVRPKNKAYLHLQESWFFADATDYKLSEFGLLNTSDSQSTQQVTSVLTDLGTVAGKAAGDAILYDRVLTFEEKPPVEHKPNPCTRLTSGVYEFELIDGSPLQVKTLDNELVDLAVKIDNGGSAPESSDPACVNNDQIDGFCAFEPTPIKVSISCGSSLVVAPKIVNSYTASRVIKPQRNFLTNRHEIHSFTNGVHTEAKMDSQSELKGVFDVILALPKGILSVLPTPTNQTTTQLQTGGGKPAQTTTTTQITIVPPK